LITRTYNVADIVRTGRDYPFDSAIIPPTIDPNYRDLTSQANPRGLFGSQELVGVSKEGNPMTRSSKSAIDIEHLVLVIQKTVDPDSWRWDNSGVERTKEMVGTIQPLGSLLIVTQTKENQKMVQMVLESIRLEYGPMKMVGVNLRWVELDPAQARQLIGDQQKGAVTTLDDAAVQKLPAEATWAAGRTTCFSGQTVYVASGRGRTWMHQATPVVGTNAAAYQMDSQLVQSGAVVQITPLLSQNGQTAVLDLTSVATDWMPMDQSIHVGGAAGDPTLSTTRPLDQISTQVDRLNVGVQQLRTTVRVPVGKMVLVGGMTKEPGTDGKEMYLIAEVTAGE
jgi:hypothetical protein